VQPHRQRVQGDADDRGVEDHGQGADDEDQGALEHRWVDLVLASPGHACLLNKRCIRLLLSYGSSIRNASFSYFAGAAILVDVAEQLKDRPTEPPGPQRQRRRGEELEAALLEAAWDELVAVGFGKLTMESVAARARTGVAVLYRRWPRKDDLVLAAMRHYGQTRPVPIPDTGSLRGDMLALLGDVNEGRSSFTAIVSSVFAGLLADSGLTPAEIRAQILGDRPRWSDEIFRRAQERGEIDLDRLSPTILEMPFDLLRHDMLMTLEPVPWERITSIVDDLFLPLATGKVPSGP
jgi:AcrR family transcriptional regulator